MPFRETLNEAWHSTTHKLRFNTLAYAPLVFASFSWAPRRSRAPAGALEAARVASGVGYGTSGDPADPARPPESSTRRENAEKNTNKLNGVLHIDNSCRIQLVKETDNSLYYGLIKKFFDLSNIPLLLNTSLNLKGEPIVDNPIKAISTFLRSNCDIACRIAQF